jgi:hypothetical protein
MLKGATNPSSVGDTNGFQIKTNYDGADLDVTDLTTTTGRTATLTAAPTNIVTASVDLDPSNEGVQSIYTVSFVTVSALTNNNIIVIQFPLIYDQLLGEKIKCEITAGFTGVTYFLMIVYNLRNFSKTINYFKIVECFNRYYHDIQNKKYHQP